MALPAPRQSDPAITEILVSLDQSLSDLEHTCDAIEAYVEAHRTADQHDLMREVDSFERSIRSETCSLSSFVQNLETETTRSRIVPEQEAAS